MKTITIISELPSDIFSDYLSGKGYGINRMSILTLQYLNSYDKKELSGERFLLVNINPRLALQVKAQFPESKVMLVNGGGSEKFTSLISIIYGLEDSDNYHFSSWEEFEEIIFGDFPKKEKKLVYNPSNELFEYTGKPFDINYFSYRLYSDKIDGLVEDLIPTSLNYLKWQKIWIDKVRKFEFYVDFNFQTTKKIKQLKFEYDGPPNELDEIPLMKEGSIITLYAKDKKGDILSNIDATVKKIEENKIWVIFPTEIPMYFLNNFSFFVIKLDYLSYKTNNQKDLIEGIKERVNVKHYVDTPMEFLKTRWQERNAYSQYMMSLSKDVFNSIKVNLSTRSKMILRNDSQIEALIECLSPNFFSVIQGPAGTGKTALASVVIEQFVKIDFTVIVTSHTNRGVDNLLIESSKIIGDRSIVRLGNNEEKIAMESKIFQKKNKNSKREPSNISVIGCTLDNISQAENYIKEMGFYRVVVIIEEASKGFFHENIHAISLSTTKVIAVLDDQQIGNIKIPKKPEEYLQKEISWMGEDESQMVIKEFNNGFFNTIIDKNIIPSILLDINYRSLKGISDLVSSAFYNSKVKCGNFNPKEKGLIVFYDTKEVEKAVNQKDGTSSFNKIEVKFLKKKFMQRLVGVIKNGGSIKNFIIITSYQSQVKLFQRELRKDLLYCESLNGQITPENIDEILNELVVTVDSVQGGEKDFVFISMVRSNEYNNIGFNNDHRRIRVTYTRAKKEMIIIGNSDTYQNCGHPDIEKIFRIMIPYIKKHGIYVKLKNLN